MTLEPCPYCQQTVLDVLAILDRYYGGKGGARATSPSSEAGQGAVAAPANPAGASPTFPSSLPGTPAGSFFHPLPCSQEGCTERVELPYKRRDGTPTAWSLNRRYMCKRHANEVFRVTA